ncbi:MAG: hypothetical protein LH467_03150 [Gemmatimonadaceae bacterium]|nr:hypothetical protein [Gemmatimonadaceae bacterium]
MIARHEGHEQALDIWARLAAPLARHDVAWRQDGRIVTKDGRHSARFVAYVEANTVRERLDGVVPGEWDLTLELLPPTPALDDDASSGGYAFKARLQILGVIREDVGTGRDYKQAATDAFKRVAVRFGVAHELYALEQNWVEMDGDGRYARPVEDPALSYARRFVASAIDEPSCPKCGGRVWDNRADKRNPRAPDFKCRARSCDGAIWPARADRRHAAGDEPLAGVAAAMAS